MFNVQFALSLGLNHEFFREFVDVDSEDQLHISWVYLSARISEVILVVFLELLKQFLQFVRSSLVNLMFVEEGQYVLNPAVPFFKVVSGFVLGRVFAEYFQLFDAFGVHIDFICGLILVVVKAKHALEMVEPLCFVFEYT